MATHFGPPHRNRTTAPWRRLDSRASLHRRVRIIAIALGAALLAWTWWLAVNQPVLLP